jgi:hypothetical protein
VSLRSELRLVRSVTISAHKNNIRFVFAVVSYLRFLCLFASMLPVSLDCLFVSAPSVVSITFIYKLVYNLHSLFAEIILITKTLYKQK